MQKKDSTVINLISMYFIVHGVLYLLSPFIRELLGVWNNYLAFMFGNITLSSMFLVPFILGAAYIIVGCALLLRMQWAVIPLLVLCAQALFFEFPVGTIISAIIIIIVFTKNFSRDFKKISKQQYHVAGVCLIAVGIFSMLFVSGVATGVLRFTAYQFTTFDVSGRTPESKIAGIEQKVGIMDVVIELTASPEYALEQQDLILDDIAKYIIEIKQHLSEVSNCIVAKVEASKLPYIAENKYVEHIYPVKPSFMIAPHELSDAEVFYNVPVQLAVQNLWDQGITGKGITIAVMDTGIKEDHPDLQRDGKSVVVGGLHLHGEYVYEHGTMVASCIANQNPEYKGIAPDVNILNIEVFSWKTVNGVQYLTATNADILQGFEFVANWKKLTGDFVILSCSWGVSSQFYSRDADVAINAANRLATEYNIPVIAAAGNSGPGSPSKYTSIPFQLMSPAGGKNVLSVGAIDSSSNVAGFSSRGPYYDGLDKPDVVAPGVDVPVLDYTGITTASGTSFACPYVSGVAALLAQKNNGITANQLYDALRNGADDLGVAGFDYEYGYGVVNAEKSVSYIDQSISNQNYVLLLLAIIIIGAIVIAYPHIKK